MKCVIVYIHIYRFIFRYITTSELFICLPNAFEAVLYLPDCNVQCALYGWYTMNERMLLFAY